MKQVKILDCTLRDGGYLVDKCFGDKNIHGIIDGLVDAEIDIIELGFLQNEGFGKGKTVFLNSADAKKYVPLNHKNSMFTAFADCSRYDVANLDECDGKSFQAVRECFFKPELRQAIDNCVKIKEKGYLCFVQPVDILGYSDKELIELIEQVNLVNPYCLSIVDTFGSMYEEDLQRIFSLIHHNLLPTCKIGFHSHNNLQMSSALTQAFIKIAYGKREVVVDSTISGMGRGAGNTPTELVVQYLVDKMGYSYDIDAILDVIDHYMRNIRSKADWGYSTYFYIAGAYNAHVNNIAFLSRKNSIRARDIRHILNQVGKDARKRYDYERLETLYLDYMKSDIDDSDTISKLRLLFEGKSVLILAAGKSILNEKEKILKYIKENSAIVISINCLHEDYQCHYLYFSNVNRFRDYHRETSEIPLICTSNVKQNANVNEYIVSFSRLIKCGWENMDNSTIMLLRLLAILHPLRIGIAGFDGYEVSGNYAEEEQEYSMSVQEAMFINMELSEMLRDFMNSNNNLVIDVVTKSKLFVWRNM